ncbi:acyltransferase family protein [Lysobacter cavernae]|uniref:Acyltransferase family protein n=1 Tax=Lysobacter cavernae TaxID=1685901 RepID=A0ABV7RPB0_9GAMM
MAAPANAGVEQRATVAAMRRAETVYRPDIDGLRAVAVLSVVIYHLNKAWMPGGYVGVDIFFVISGYLITRNIWGEMEDNRFSFANFYLRRIRRIAPAFLVMTAVTLAAGALTLLPEDLLALGKSALWGVFSLSNVYFWRYLDTGYFADSADEVPLLHTWSLGVEEQFYFLWPSVLLLASMARSRRAAALSIAAAICVASFAIGEMTNLSAQKFAYYMLPARAGELMVGALLALWMRNPWSHADDARRAGAEVLAAAGFGLIAWSLYALDDNSAFPGINAIYPCLGAALLMLAGGMGSRLVGFVLTPRPMVFVGLISYSLYLWHWPILAFLRYFLGEVEGWWIVGAVVAMFALAYASYRWVELPARHWRGGRLKQAIVLYAAPSAVLCAMAGTIWYSGGLRATIESAPGYREGRARLAAYTSPANESVSYNCIVNEVDEKILDDARCLTGDLEANEGRPDVLLWGDSLAAAYLGTMSVFAKEERLLVRNATHSACPPVFGEIEYGMPRFHASCSKFRANMQPHILSGSYRVVVISGGWAQYDKDARFREDFRATVVAMTSAGIDVVIIGQMPWMQNYNRECDSRGVRLGLSSCEARMSNRDTGGADIEGWLEGLAQATPRVTYLTPRNVICRSGLCSPYLDGRPVYYDKSHLSMSGSWAVGRHLLVGPERTAWSTAVSRGNRMGANDMRAVTTAEPVAEAFRPRLLPFALGGYYPSFPYHVRSQQGLDSTRGPAAAVLEYWGVNEGEVLASIERDMGSLGFTPVARRASGGATRLDFEKPGVPRVSVSVGPLGMLQPQAPKVAGVVYLRW